MSPNRLQHLQFQWLRQQILLLRHLQQVHEPRLLSMGLERRVILIPVFF